MVADLWSDLLGAQTDVSAGERRWLSPLGLWAGILAGPIAWALDLTASYAAVKPVCRMQSDGLLHLITFVCLAMVMSGALISWFAFQRTPGDTPTDGGQPRERARFMAILGLTASAMFAVQILAAAIPRWVIDACQ
jgi:hypothetical protein